MTGDSDSLDEPPQSFRKNRQRLPGPTRVSGRAKQCRTRPEMRRFLSDDTRGISTRAWAKRSLAYGTPLVYRYPSCASSRYHTNGTTIRGAGERGWLPRYPPLATWKRRFPTRCPNVRIGGHARRRRRLFTGRIVRAILAYQAPVRKKTTE